MAMTMTMPGPVTLPPLRQQVVDHLAALLSLDDRPGFEATADRLDASRAERAAAAAGVLDGGGLGLAAIEEALLVLGDVTRLPDPEHARTAVR